MCRYCLYFTLNIQNNITVEVLRNSIIEFGEILEIYQVPEDITVKGTDFRISIRTEDPIIIFDTCSQFGKLKSIKIDEEAKK